MRSCFALFGLLAVSGCGLLQHEKTCGWSFQILNLGVHVGDRHPGRSADRRGRPGGLPGRACPKADAGGPAARPVRPLRAAQLGGARASREQPMQPGRGLPQAGPAPALAPGRYADVAQADADGPRAAVATDPGPAGQVPLSVRQGEGRRRAFLLDQV